MKPVTPVKNTQPVASINEEIMNKLRSFFSTGQTKTSTEDSEAEASNRRSKPPLLVVKPKMTGTLGDFLDDEGFTSMPKNTFIKKYPAPGIPKEKKPEKIIEVAKVEEVVAPISEPPKIEQTPMTVESKLLPPPPPPEVIKIPIRKWEEFHNTGNLEVVPQSDQKDFNPEGFEEEINVEFIIDPFESDSENQCSGRNIRDFETLDTKPISFLNFDRSLETSIKRKKIVGLKDFLEKLQNRSLGMKKYECDQCMRKFYNHAALGGHKSKRHPKSSKKYIERKTIYQLRKAERKKRTFLNSL